MAHHSRPLGVVAVGQPALPRQALPPLLPPLLGVHLQALQHLRPPAGEHREGAGWIGFAVGRWHGRHHLPDRRVLRPAQVAQARQAGTQQPLLLRIEIHRPAHMQRGALAQLQEGIDEGAPLPFGLAVAAPKGVERWHRFIAVHGPESPDLAELAVGQVIARWLLGQQGDQPLGSLRQLSGLPGEGKGTI